MLAFFEHCAVLSFGVSAGSSDLAGHFSRFQKGPFCRIRKGPFWCPASSCMILGSNLHFPRKMSPLVKKTFSAAIFAGMMVASLTSGSAFALPTLIDIDESVYHPMRSEQGDAEGEQNFAEAVKRYRKAAEQGDAGAQFNLAFCYAKGQGVDKNFAEALKWYRKAAEQGDARAQNNLGVLYSHGQGVKTSDFEARKWYLKAAEQGNATAQNNLGICYENGYGVRQSYTKAKEYYGLACDNGDDFGCTEYARLNKRGY